MDDGNQQAPTDAGDVAVHEIVRGPAPPDHRHVTDRRKRPTRLFSQYWLRGRRRGGRRDGERENIYVDRYTRGEWALILGTLICAIADALLTIDFARSGGHQGNPVMNALLGEGWATFVVVKLAVTLLGLGYILMHIRFKRIRLYLVLVFGLSVALLIYQLGVRWALAL
jgi:hypothetical protein